MRVWRDLLREGRALGGGRATTRAGLRGGTARHRLASEIAHTRSALAAVRGEELFAPAVGRLLEMGTSSPLGVQAGEFFPMILISLPRSCTIRCERQTKTQREKP